jgi:hypothetical protein
LCTCLILASSFPGSISAAQFRGNGSVALQKKRGGAATDRQLRLLSCKAAKKALDTDENPSIFNAN